MNACSRCGATNSPNARYCKVCAKDLWAARQISRWDNLWFGPLNGVRLKWWRYLRTPARRLKWRVGFALMRLSVWWRPPGFVCWGGRPELDVQIGSRDDRIITARAKHQAELRRIARRMTVQFTFNAAALTEAMQRMAKAAGEAAVKIGQAMGPLVEAAAKLDQNMGLRPPTN